MEELIEKYFCNVCQNKCKNCPVIQTKTEKDVEITKCINFIKKEENKC